MIEIDAALERDIKDIATVEAKSAENPWSEKQFFEELTQPHARLLAAKVNGAVVGFLDLHIVADDAHINELAVSPVFRRIGVGSAMIERACEAAREANCAEISLEVRSENKAARALYESLGFEVVGVRKNLYDAPLDDGVIMVKRL